MAVAPSKNLKVGADLDTDALDTPEQTARWLHIAERTLLANVRAGKIPVVRINARVFRFHKPTVLAALQK